MLFDNVKISAYRLLNLFGSCVDNSACDVDSAVLHKVTHALGQKHNCICNNICKHNVIFALDLIGKASADCCVAVCNAVDFGVLGGSSYGGFVNVNADRTVCTEQKRCNREYSASATDVEHRVALFHILLAHLKAKTGCFVTTRTERKTGVDVQNDSAVCVVVVTPARTDKQFFADLNRIEILFPVVAPVLLGAVEKLDCMLNSLGVVTLGKEGYSLGRRNVRLKIDVNKGFVSVFF